MMIRGVVECIGCVDEGRDITIRRVYSSVDILLGDCYRVSTVHMNLLFLISFQ